MNPKLHKEIKMSSHPILTEKKDHIGIITLNRPEALNTFTIAFAEDLNAALMQMDEDDDVRVIIIRGAGKHFSTGIALDEFKDKNFDAYRKMIQVMDLHNHTIARMKKPVIASVQGYALANGSGLAFACDLTVAAEDARFGTTAINVGLICLGPAVPLARLVGRKKTLEMVLTGDFVSAEEAQRLGLVNQVVLPEDLEKATMELARKLAAKSPKALQIGKQGIYGMMDLPYHQSLDYLGELFASLCITEDAHEGLLAFAEKRTPIWKNR